MIRPGRAQVRISQEILGQLLRLPEGVYVRRLEWEADTDTFRMYLYGGSLPRVGEGIESPMINAVFEDGQIRLEWRENAASPNGGTE